MNEPVRPSDNEILDAMVDADSMLGLLIYRAGIRDWKGLGGKDEAEAVMFALRRVYEALARSMNKRLTA